MTEQVTCMDCGDEFVPSFSRDFYADGVDQTKGRCEGCFMRKLLAPKAPVPIQLGYDDTVCLMGKGAACCSYLGMLGAQMFCLKGSEFDASIRQRRADGSIGAKGDNCSGPPAFKIEAVS